MQKKDNSGVLFKNDRKQKETHPDYVGNCLIDGKLWFMSAWLKNGKKGDFYSIAFNLPKETIKTEEPKEEEIPF